MQLLLILYASLLYKRCLRGEICVFGKGLVMLVVRESFEILKYIILLIVVEEVPVFVFFMKRV